MVIFHSYVSLPEGISLIGINMGYKLWKFGLLTNINRTNQCLITIANDGIIINHQSSPFITIYHQVTSINQY